MRGGRRPGAGRKPGSKDKKPRKRPDVPEKEKIRQMLAMGDKAKLKMYQEFLLRVANRDKDGNPLNLPPLSVAEKRLMAKLGEELAAGITEKAAPELETCEDLEAAEYLRKVWNDPKMDADLRVKAAEIVLKVAGEKKGKKDEKADRAKQAGSGKFAAGVAPIRVVK
jgi:hypothetical protein